MTFLWNASSTSSSNASACLSAKSLIGVMCELLRLEADAGVELHFESLAGIRVDPLAVDSLVLLFGPGVLEFLQFKTLGLLDARCPPRHPECSEPLDTERCNGSRRAHAKQPPPGERSAPSSVSETFSLMRSRPFRRSSKPIRWRSGSWLSMARSAGVIFSRSRSAIRSHAASTRLLSATFRNLSPSPRQEPGGSSGRVDRPAFLGRPLPLVLSPNPAGFRYLLVPRVCRGLLLCRDPLRCDGLLFGIGYA